MGESRQAEDSVLAELQEKFEVCTYISPSPQVPGYQLAMTRDFQYDFLFLDKFLLSSPQESE